MPDREAFFASIREHPDDDTPRLVFADWLDENGDCAHAELIRVQCEIERLGTGDPQLAMLKTREKELLASKFGDCLEPKLNESDCPHILITRGFVSELACNYRWYLANDELCGRSAPALRVSFIGPGAQEAIDSNAELAKISECTSLSSWVLLSIVGFYAERIGEGFRKLVESPHLNNLLQLEIQGFELGAEGLRALACSSIAQRLQIMRLSFAVLNEEEMRAGVGDEAIQVMLASRSLPNLQKLGLYGIITDRGAEGLFASPGIAGMNELYLGGEQLGAAGISALTRSPHLTGLKCLRLRDVKLTSNETRLLADWLPRVPLVELNLANAEMDAEGIRNLCNWPRTSALRELYLDGMSDESIAAVASSPSVSGLERLSVCWDMRDVSLWAVSPPPPQRTDASVFVLASSRYLRSLKYLGFGPGNFGDEAARAVINSPILLNLRESPFWSANSFSKNTIEALRKRFGRESATAAD
jgi:uncharacterized protein (TIGR02996 family)